MAEIEIRLSGSETKFIINNMYPLYLHDLAGIRGVLPNNFGVFEDSDKYQTLQQQISVFDIWWEKEGVLFPFLITVDEVPAGFALIATPPYILDDSNYLVNEFFILKPFRSKGIAEYAVKEIFNRFRGKWLVFTTPTDKNALAIEFWRKTISRYTIHGYTEVDKELPDVGFSKVFNFSNKNV
ncbi:GNAT family N-acetyltransferase [Paenibacillus tarimensis]